jgi:arabinose-5-phosphate isomerase
MEKCLDQSHVTFVEWAAACKGRLVFTGIGKSGIIARKLAATFSSTGTSAYFLDPTSGIHGDLGVLGKDDMVIALSKSGNTEEVLRLIPYIKRMGIRLVSMTEQKNSPLAKHSLLVLRIPAEPEACPYNLAPTTSTTMQLVLGDALAIALLKAKGFSRKDFALLHPGGSLGRQLMKVKEVMRSRKELPLAKEDTPMRKILETIISGRLGVAVIVGQKGKLAGIIVDGDLKRILVSREQGDFFGLKAKDVMTREPRTISPDHLVVEALSVMQGKITSLVVTDRKGIPVGLIHMHDILQKGFL